MTGSRQVAPFGAGSVLGGRYDVEGRAGTDDAQATGSVWCAWDRRLLRRVVVRRIPDSDGDDRDTREPHERASHEGRIAARVMHPKAIAVYDIVDHDDQLWLVMEYLPSRSLATLLAERGSLSPPEVAHIGAQIAEALCAVHDAGLVHGSLEPSHVLVTDEGDAKLIPVGRSRRPREGGEALPDEGRYVAPEVMRGEEPSPASDVFSLGAVLQAALGTGPVCARAPGTPAARRAHTRGRLRPASRADRVLHGPLTAMLEVHPARRASAATAQRLLGRHARPRPRPDRTTVTEAPPTWPTPHPTLPATRGPRMDQAQRSPRSDGAEADRATPTVEAVPPRGEDRPFPLVARGYDRAQVHARIRELAAAADRDRGRAWRAEQRLAGIRARIAELDANSSDEEGTGAPDPGGTPTTVDKLLAFAAEQGAQLRERAQGEAEACWERAREAAAAHRRQVEDALRERARELDESAAERRSLLERRELDLAETLEARTVEAERLREAAEREAEARRAQAHRRAEEILRNAERSAEATRAAALDDHRDLTAVSAQVGHHLRAVHRLLGDVQIGGGRPASRGPTIPAAQGIDAVAGGAEQPDEDSDGNKPVTASTWRQQAAP